MSTKNSYLTVTDQFCGAGGSSSGAKKAGAEVKMALNHWDLAIETHNTNHPEVDHDCTDIQACDPRRYPSTNILITSPECTNHSLAKGKKRKNLNQTDLFDSISDMPAERSRATMWDVVRFSEYHNYDCIVVENVVDARRWSLFESWLKAMHALGYKHKCCYLNSMLFKPCPQSRDRMYVVFWKKGNKSPDLDFRPIAPCPTCGDKEAVQVWKNSQKKFGKHKFQYIYKCSGCSAQVKPYYYAAFNCINWSHKIQRIGDRKKALSPKTIARIQHGIDNYYLPSIVTSRYTTGVGCRVRSSADYMATQPGDASHSLMIPMLTSSEWSSSDKNRPLDQEMWTHTTRQTNGIFMPPPFIVENRGTLNSREISSHLTTATTVDNHGLLVAPFIVENNGTSKSRPILQALSTATGATTHGVIIPEKWNAFLQYYYSSGATTTGMTDQINTMTTNDRAYLVEPSVNVDDCFYRMLKPDEIQSAMAFDNDYIVLGNSRQKTKQLGNAVTPPVMEWLIDRVMKSLER